MEMTHAKRHQIRAKQEEMQKARKEERLGLAKKTTKKKGRKEFLPPSKKIKKKLKKVLTFDLINVTINM